MSFTLLPTIAWCGSALWCPQQPTSVPVDVLMHNAPGYEFSGGGGPSNVIRYVDGLNEARQLFTVPLTDTRWDYEPTYEPSGYVPPPPFVPPPVIPPPPPCCAPPPPPPPVVTATPEPATWCLTAFGLLAALVGLKLAHREAN